MIKKYIRNLYQGFGYFYRALRLRLLITPLDRKRSFSGPIAEMGYSQQELDKKDIDLLKRKFDQSPGNIVFENSDMAVIQSIFDLLTPQIVDYLGATVRLDGINWIVTEKNEGDVSGRWHTDNVGNRIKCFVCIEGDGNQPTWIVPREKRILPFVDWIWCVIVESVRWFGANNTHIIKTSLALRHRPSTVYTFDTDLFHRGGYEKSDQRRVILHFEFSNPDKHPICKGPIGTYNHNSFSFHDTLLEIGSFRKVLDERRIHKADKPSYSFYAN